MAKRDKEIPEKKKRQSARVPKLETLGKYQIQKEIGAGGMGAVFLAKDTTLNRLAALKILPRDKAENPVLVKRFKAEGQAAAHLRHENIVSVYDAGEEDGYLYIALEYVEGTDLHNLINKRGRIPVRRSLEIITQVTQALAHAYQQGIVHRDIKPANILIRLDGVVKLTDLGLARSIDDNTETSITRAGTTVGTVDYMAPEQARDSKAADIRSDLYSLGCSWYHMLTGRAPFSEGSLTNKLAAHAATPPPDPRELNERVPEGVVAIIQRMMAKSQNERYQTPEELLADLKNSNLKRSNVENNVLEGLANDESDSEHATLETGVNQAADSSDFLINQFMPDYSSRAEDQEEESSSRLSTSFDLQQLATELEKESEASVPLVERPAKSVKRPIAPESLRDASEESSKSRRSPPPIEEGSVISDSVMKIRKSAPSQKAEASVEQRKSARPTPQGSKTPGKGPATERRPQRSSRKIPPVVAEETAASEGQISVDFKQIGMLIGGVIFLILLVWWGIKALSSSDPGPQGSGSNPFVSADQNPVDPAKHSPSGTGDQAAADENAKTEPMVKVAENSGVNQSADPNKQPNEKWQNVAVRGREKQHLPEWGPGFSALLAGPNRSKTDLKLPVFKVAKSKTEAGVYGSLNEAIKAVTSKGAVIRLFGQGPFLLSQHRLQNISPLIIMADAEQNPVVVIQADEKAANQSEMDLISFSSGVLRFQGIHFLCDVSQLPGTGTCNIFGINQSDLTFQNCSFSLTGKNQREIRFINSTGDPRSSTGHPQGESRIFLENSVIAGSQLKVIHVDQPFADVLISNCFISTTGATCLELASLGKITKNDLIWEERKTPRTVRIFSSTLLSDHSIFELNGSPETKDEKQPDKAAVRANQTEIIVVNSVLIGSPEKKQSSMVTLINWPQDKLREQSKNRFDGLKFQVESALLWGWPLYLRSMDSDNTQNVFQIDSHRTWQQSWGELVAADTFNTELPPELNELRAPAFVRSLLDFSKQKAVYAISEGGVIAGCDPAVLKSLSQGQLKRIQAYLGKPQIEQGIHDQFTKAKTVAFDMTKGDLSEFLNGSAVSGPTNVTVSGQGICYTSPILIENKQIRLQFQPKKGEHPIVELKLFSPSAQKLSRDQKTAGISSFITLKNSTLEIIGGKFRISSERKGVVPQHFLVCQNSRVALDQCALDAMLINDRRFQSVVSVAPSTNGKPDQILMNHTFLSSSGTIIESHTPQLGVAVQNSLLLSLRDIFALETEKSASPPSIYLSLNQSTFAPGGSVFAFQQISEGTAAGPAPVQIFADDSVFMPAPATSAVRSDFSRSAALFSIPQGFLEKKRIQWWGDSDGFMIERLDLLAGSGSSSQQTDAEFLKEMSRLFGEETNQNALAIRGGIILQEQKLPPLIKIEPVHFQLLPTCKAASWSELKQPLGADPVALQAMIQGGEKSPEKTGRIKRAF
tara:strand:- start:61598 stop:65935 length:4338 start_codon:yes stop_codon:yes gene_type:complete